MLNEFQLNQAKQKRANVTKELLIFHPISESVNMAGAFAMLWDYFRNVPPSLLLGSLEFVLGGLTFLSMFHGFINVVGVLKLKNGQILSYSDNVSLSCKMVSAIFACVSCITGVVGKFQHFKNQQIFV